MHRRLRIEGVQGAMAATLAIAVSSGCSEPEAHVAAQCNGHVALQVGPGTRPTITWQPPCGVGNVFVVSASDTLSEEPVWVATSLTSSITPPVVYGSKPAGAQEAFQLVVADSLTIGAQYLVIVGPPLRGGISDSILFTVRATTP